MICRQAPCIGKIQDIQGIVLIIAFHLFPQKRQLRIPIINRPVILKPDTAGCCHGNIMAVLIAAPEPVKRNIHLGEGAFLCLQKRNSIDFFNQFLFFTSVIQRPDRNRFPIKIIHLEGACIRACTGKDVTTFAITSAVSYSIQNRRQNKQNDNQNWCIFFHPKLFICFH